MRPRGTEREAGTASPAEPLERRAHGRWRPPCILVGRVCGGRAAAARRGSLPTSGRIARLAANAAIAVGSTSVPSATTGPSSSSSGSAPPPSVTDRPDNLAAASRRAASERRRARCASAPHPSSSIASTGISRRDELGVAVKHQRRLECGERQLVDLQRPREGMLRAGVATAETEPSKAGPACGPPSSLSPEQQTSAAPAWTDLRSDGSLGQRRRSRSRRRGRRNRRRRSPGRRVRTAARSRPPRRSRATGSSTDGRGGSRQPESGMRRRLAVVGGPASGWSCPTSTSVALLTGAIHLGDAEPSADLHQLAARDDRSPGLGPASAAAASSTAAAPLLSDDRRSSAPVSSLTPVSATWTVAACPARRYPARARGSE